MGFTPNQEVRVLCKVGLQPKPIWQIGHFISEASLGDGGTVYSVKVGSHIRLMTDGSIVAYVRIDGKKVDDFAKQTWSQLCSQLRQAVKAFFPSMLEGMTYDNDDRIVSFAHENITVQPAIVEHRNWNAHVEMPGWGVSKWITLRNYPHAPDDVDEQTVATSQSVAEIVKSVLHTMLDYQIEDWENKRFIDSIDDESPDEVPL